MPFQVNGSHREAIGWEAVALNCNCGYVLHGLHMARCNTVVSIESRTSHGPYLLEHPGLAGVAGFTGGQDAAPSILEVHADLIGV